MTLADTPTTWLEGHSLSTLQVLVTFAGIPLLVILVVSLLVYAPTWVNGPRYRPGQQWNAKSEWLGSTVPADMSMSRLEVGRSTPATDEAPEPARRVDEPTGGASAGW